MGHPLYVQVDLFFYREPEEAKQQDEEEAVALPDYGVEYSAAPLVSDQWPLQGSDPQWTDLQAPISAVPATWSQEPGRTKLHSFTLAY
jgi:small subunit ribosomal protein SAe